MNEEKRAPYDENPCKLPKKSTEMRTPYSLHHERVAQWRVVAYRKGEFAFPVLVEIYKSKSRSSNTLYANIWAHNADMSLTLRGCGTAGGCGYHKESGVIDEACRDAGIVFRASFHGCGSNSIKVALESLARKLGYRKFTIIN